MTRRKPPSSAWSRIGPWLPVIIAGLLVAAGIAYAVASGMKYADIVAFMEDLNPAMLVACMALLPVVGFSVGAVYLIAGAKFGLVGGGLVVALVTAIHLLLTHVIARSVLRAPYERLLAKHKDRIPKMQAGDEVSVAAMIVLIPGIPYFARNAILALSGIPLRIYFWVCLPIYIIRSYVTIFLGDFGMKPSVQQLLIIGAVFAVKIAICLLLLRHLRQRHRRRAATPVRHKRAVPAHT